MMLVNCKLCGNEIELVGEVADGQHVRCPYCGGKWVYSRPLRIALPEERSARRSTCRQDDDENAVRTDSAPEAPVQPAKKPLHVIRPQAGSEPKANPEGEHRIRMAEERVRFYEEMKSMEHRRKMWGNLTSTLLLAILVGGGFGAYVFIRNNQEKARQSELKYAAERARLEAEREEQNRADRARREADEKAARERRLAEESARTAEERARRQKEEGEVFEAKVKYKKTKALFGDAEFGFITALPDAASPGKCDGEFFYLLPFLENDEIVVCESTTKGLKSVYRLNGGGVRTPMAVDGFFASLAGKDYLVAAGEKVYFHSKRKKPHIGQLDKGAVADLTKEFFGDIAPEVRRFDLDPDGLSFEVVFVPKNSKKIIVTQTVGCGVAYSLENVRMAVEEAFPMRSTSAFVSKKIKPFKRTTVLWDGAHIKRGIDGITYVPRVAPPVVTDDAHVTVSGPGWDYSRNQRSYYKARRRDVYTRDQWQTLHDEALRQESAERAYYEQQGNAHREKVHEKLSQSERKYVEKIDRILEEGALYFRAKVNTAK